MAEIVPAVLASDPVEFGNKLKKVNFAHRLHIDIALPPFTPNRTINLAQAHLHEGPEYDLHLMFDHPEKQSHTVISLKPNLAIVHFEAQGDLGAFFSEIKKVRINAGLALLPETSVAEAKSMIEKVDHVLVFTGHLGYYGGDLKEECLPKIAEIKAINPDIEVSVDGGVNPLNAKRVAEAGADVLVSGGFIVGAANPKAAMRELLEVIGD